NIVEVRAHADVRFAQVVHRIVIVDPIEVEEDRLVQDVQFLAELQRSSNGSASQARQLRYAGVIRMLRTQKEQLDVWPLLADASHRADEYVPALPPVDA